MALVWREVGYWFEVYPNVPIKCAKESMKSKPYRRQVARFCRFQPIFPALRDSRFEYEPCLELRIPPSAVKLII